MPELEPDRRLYTTLPDDSIDYIPQLRQLLRKLLAEYLHLLEILANNPSEHRTAMESIELHFFNMHHLLNSYRPHQAYQTLVELLANQVARRQALMASAEDKFQRVRATIVEAKGIAERENV